LTHLYQLVFDISRTSAGGSIHANAIPQMPEWQTLFGSLDLCQCEHCRSVYSPASYLVDLLQLLNQKPPKGTQKTKKPLDALRSRRPDLTHIKLTCENTSTPMPYIDLVNEILEYYVVHEKLTNNTAKNTEGITAEELRVNPQHTETEAYNILKQAFYPFSAPFDRDIEIARVYLNHLGTSRYEIMRYFFKSTIGVEPPFFIRLTPGNNNQESPYQYPAEFPDSTVALAHIDEDTTIACESLNISHREASIIVGIFPSALKSAYGFSDQSGDQQLSQFHNAPVSQFIQRLGIRYIDLLELLKTRFINPLQLSSSESGHSLSHLTGV
jgi:hypothetical protein